MNKLLEMLPSIPFHSSRQYKKITEVQEKYLDLIEIDIEDLEKQLIIDTATWGLYIYERELGLITDRNRPLSERRANIKAKMLGAGKVGAELLEEIVMNYTGIDVKVKFIDGEIVFDIPIIKNIETIDLINSINTTIPAHLSYMINFIIESLANLNIASTTLTGADITVYPYMDDEIESIVNVEILSSLDTQIQDFTIYPKGVI